MGKIYIDGVEYTTNGPVINDLSTSATMVWSSQKTNSEISAINSDIENIVDTITNNGAHNLLPNELTTQTINGITVTVNEDKSVIINGTASANTFFTIGVTHLRKGTYKLVGIPEDITGGYGIIQAYVYSENPSEDLHWLDLGSNQSANTKTLESDTDIIVRMAIYTGFVANNIVYKPMITLASDPSTEYAPHAMTNRELTEKKLDLNSPDPLKEMFVESTVVSSMDMTSLTSIKAFLTDYTGVDHLGTSIVNVRSGSNGQRATFIISNVNTYAMAIMVSFYNRDISSSCGLMAFYRAGNDWYSMPITGTWSPIA